jgi:trimeric autotransporter adhesin
VWRKSIALTFDRSPTGVRGAADGTVDGWQYVNPAYPCAPWPEMVFVDGTALEQVSTLGAVGPGKFFVEGSYTGLGTAVYEFTSTAYVIGDDPTGKEVRVSDLVTCLTQLATDLTVRGLGVRRYAASVFDYGVIKLNRARGILEHVVVEDCSGRGVWADGTGLGVGVHTGTRLTNCTVQRCSLVGVGGSKADDAVLERCRIVYNTNGLFNRAPVSGGVKWHKSLNFTTDDCEISDNYRQGWWCDESVTGMLVRGCDVQRNGGNGLVPEISEAAVIVNCVITDNTRSGIYNSGVNSSRVWCNTIARNGSEASGLGNVYVYQDTRRPATFSQGMDNRFDLAWHVANCSWDIRAWEFFNNICDEPPAAGSGYKAQDPGLTQDGWNGMGLTMGGNLYCQRSANVPQMFFMPTTDTSVSQAWASFAPYAAHVSPQDATSVENRGTGWCVLDEFDVLSPQGAAVASGVAIPADIAALLGVATGSTQVGATR